ncbi:MAG: nucleotidyl transferase AbiEii/AbiGii toxin family protein [Chloroflexi bacterium]|nr:nucleotidyl transferase AbiEii/AbiGii toxin family protein [Chloroflexota bacterium]
MTSKPTFESLDRADRLDALQVAEAVSNRPAYLLEKDTWVVYTLQALMQTAFAERLTFKGGTSLSKGYDAILRFSEDIDITYDILAVAGDIVAEKGDQDGMPRNVSQAGKWRKKIRKRLRQWISEEIEPTLRSRLAVIDEAVTLRSEGEQLSIGYRPLFDGPAFVKPAVLVDFGALSSGEPREMRVIACDAARNLPEIDFPTAKPMVMSPVRTYWEKATAIHVYCCNTKMPSERLSRHWHDLLALDRTTIGDQALRDRSVAEWVAKHKASFFRERDAGGEEVDYTSAVRGSLRLVPDGDGLQALKVDYEAMASSGMLHEDADSFDSLMAKCKDLEERANLMRLAQH